MRGFLLGEKGVSVVVGVLLVGAVLIGAFTLFYREYMVSEWRQNEGKHGETVKVAFLNLRSKIEDLSPGDSKSIAIKMSADPISGSTFMAGSVLFVENIDMGIGGLANSAMGVTQEIVYPTAESEVWEEEPNRRGNFQGDEVWISGMSFGPYRRRVFYKFDLSSLPEGAIQTARFYFYFDRIWWNPTFDNRTSVHPVSDDSWGHRQLTWNTQPGYGAVLDWRSIPDPSWVGWDITSFIGQERQGDGIASISVKAYVEGLTAESIWRGFDYPSYQPYLLITYGSSELTLSGSQTLGVNINNIYFSEQAYVYEAGAVILAQDNESVMLSPTLITAGDADSNNINVDLTYVVIGGENKVLNTTGISTVIASSENFYTATEPVGSPNAENVVIGVRSVYWDAWRGYFSQLADELNSKGYNASVTGIQENVELNILGKDPNPGVNDIYFTEKIKLITITLI